MRNIILFLTLYCLTLSRTQPCTSTDFCSTSDDVTLDDYKWTFLDSLKKIRIPIFLDKCAEIDHGRAILFELKGSATATKTITILSPTEKYDQCKNVFTRTVKTGIQSKVELLKISVSNQKDIEPGSEVLIAVFDPECVLYIETSNDQNMKIFHIFQKNAKVEGLPSPVDKEDDLKNGKYLYMETNEVLSANLLKYNIFNEVKQNEYTQMECFHLCKKGNKIEVKLQPQMPFGHVFKFSRKCEWFNIYMDETTDKKGTEISLRHGIVTFHHELRANVLNFRSIDQKSYEVTVAYSKQGSKALLVVGNSHGQAARASQSSGYKELISFVFSNEDCLINAIGDETQKFGTGINLGLLALRNGHHGYSYAVRQQDNFESEKRQLKEEAEQKRNELNPDDIKHYDTDYNRDIIESVTPIEEAEVVTEVTIASVDESHTRTRRIPMNTEIDEKDFIKAEKERIHSIKKALEDPGYSYWAIPAGFALGSATSVIICNIILAIFSRTIFTVWYKAMYKKYGSATTMGAGTTMGKTCGGETMGGTTAGGATVGATTMGGETTSATTAA